MKFTYIYGIVDPRKPKFVVYVGKADNPLLRLHNHIYGVSVNKKKDAWIKALCKIKIEPQIIILQKVQFKNWEKAEKNQIAKWHRININLFNIAKGGSYPSVNWKDRKMRNYVIAAVKKGIDTATWRTHHKAAMQRRAKDIVLQKKIDLARSKALNTPIWRRRNKAAMRRLALDPTHQARNLAHLRRLHIIMRNPNSKWRRNVTLSNQNIEKRAAQSKTLRATHRRKKLERQRNKQ